VAPTGSATPLTVFFYSEIVSGVWVSEFAVSFFILRVPAFCIPIFHIVGASAKKKVIWIDATRHVAFMQNG
jgi:hypothetical protein